MLFGHERCLIASKSSSSLSYGRILCQEQNVVINCRKTFLCVCHFAIKCPCQEFFLAGENQYFPFDQTVVAPLTNTHPYTPRQRDYSLCVAVPSARGKMFLLRG